MCAYCSTHSVSSLKKNSHATKRLYRRTNKLDAIEFNQKKKHQRVAARPKYSEQELDQWLTQTFAELFAKNRVDHKKYPTKEQFIHAGLHIGIVTKKIYFSLETLLNDAHISETKIASKDIWLFSLYQTLRTIEKHSYQGQHLYTSLVGKRNSELMIQQLNHFLPNWLTSSGKISKTNA